MTIARRWSWSAPATISEAEAVPASTSTIDRQAVGGVARPGIITLDVGAAAAALRDDLAALEEQVGQADRLVEQAARIGALRSRT